MMHNCSVVCHHLPFIKVSTSIRAHPQKILDIVLGYTPINGFFCQFCDITKVAINHSQTLAKFDDIIEVKVKTNKDLSIFLGAYSNLS